MTASEGGAIARAGLWYAAMTHAGLGAVDGGLSALAGDD